MKNQKIFMISSLILSIQILASCGTNKFPWVGQLNLASKEKIEQEVASCSNPIIKTASIDDFDGNYREIGNLLITNKNGKKEYRIYYTVFSGKKYKENKTYLGYSYSSDGVTWMKHNSSIIERALEDPYVLYHKGVFHLYAEDKEDVPFRNIRKYHSSDGIEWFDDGDIFDPLSEGRPKNWEDTDVSSPIVWIEEGDKWFMLYEGRGGGFKGKIGLATSSDGYNWNRLNAENRPVLDVGELRSWDSLAVVPDDIIKMQNYYLMIYHGVKRGSNFKVGFAQSQDLKNWVKYGSNPIGNVETLMLKKINDRYFFHFAEKNPNIKGICSFETKKLFKISKNGEKKLEFKAPNLFLGLF